jgi:hypothetical protein
VLNRGGERAESDRFFSFLSKVFCAKCKGLTLLLRPFL